MVVQAMGNGDEQDRGENLQGGAFDWAKIHTFSFDFSIKVYYLRSRYRYLLANHNNCFFLSLTTNFQTRSTFAEQNGLLSWCSPLGPHISDGEHD